MPAVSYDGDVTHTLGVKREEHTHYSAPPLPLVCAGLYPLKAGHNWDPRSVLLRSSFEKALESWLKIFLQRVEEGGRDGGKRGEGGRGIELEKNA